MLITKRRSMLAMFFSYRRHYFLIRNRANEPKIVSSIQLSHNFHLGLWIFSKRLRVNLYASILALFYFLSLLIFLLLFLALLFRQFFRFRWAWGLRKSLGYLRSSLSSIQKIIMLDAVWNRLFEFTLFCNLWFWAGCFFGIGGNKLEGLFNVLCLLLLS